ncbi:hypothetical protein HPB52_009312 [Rhipicephalus sanguineus]|uniref:Uncharacterized protein n=1 Tax=Rhipicephalus sanguineus TaxID=34632 RepID=A0A9D4PRA3_RHISA|nr:hypothetical protein HPB52_009312 [Rhipicephalus sanguineus]
MTVILLLIPAGYEAPNLPDANSQAHLPSQPGFPATSGQFILLETSPLDNQLGTASASTCTTHWDLKMALEPDTERIKSGRHHTGAIGHGDTVGMQSNPFIYWLQLSRYPFGGMYT